VAAGLDCPPNPGVHRLDGVRGADDAADLCVEPEERSELLPRVLPKPDDRRILLAPRVDELREPLECGFLGRSGVDGLEELGDLVPVLAGGIAEGVPQQMHDAGLHDRPGPDGLDRFGQALEPVANQHEDVADAAVLDLGEDVHPVLGSLAAVACPQAQDVPPALDGDGQGHVDRPVRHGAVADLHVDRVDEDHRIDSVEGPILPLGHAVHDLVGDRGDGLAGDFGAIDLGQIGLDLTGRQALRRQRDHHLVHAGQALLPLLDDLRLEAALAVGGHGYPDRADVRQHGLSPGPVAAVAAVLPGRVVLVIAEVVGDLAFEGGLQEPLGQLLEQPALAGQLQALGLGAANQLVDELVVHLLRWLRLSGVDGLCLGHVVAGHRCIFLDQELHRSFYSPGLLRERFELTGHGARA
jgi:hypothetical protein